MNDTAARVFIVDDDDAVRDSLSLLVESEGYAVETFPDAEAFLATLEPGQRGCVVIDVSMPGMDGWELQQEMCRCGSRLPVIFLSGYADPTAVQRAVKSGAVDFLTKPVAGSTLLRSIATALAGDGSRPANRARPAKAGEANSRGSRKGTPEPEVPGG